MSKVKIQSDKIIHNVDSTDRFTMEWLDNLDTLYEDNTQWI